MTTIADGFDMFPIALASGAGAEWKKWIGLGNYWINKFIIPNLDCCSGGEIMEKTSTKFSKGKKLIMTEMIADYGLRVSRTGLRRSIKFIKPNDLLFLVGMNSIKLNKLYHVLWWNCSCG
jgi:hypothetical protein